MKSLLDSTPTRIPFPSTIGKMNDGNSAALSRANSSGVSGVKLVNGSIMRSAGAAPRARSTLVAVS